MMKKLHYIFTLTFLCLCVTLHAQEYNFENDTAGEAASNISSYVGGATVVAYGGSNTLEVTDYVDGNIGTFTLDEFPDSKDYSVTWKQTMSGNGRKTGILLKAHGTSQYPDVIKQGYLFIVANHIRSDWQNIEIKRYEPSGTSPAAPTLKKANLAAQTSGVPRWYRVSVDGSTLTAEYSDDGDAATPTWITVVTATDDVYEDISGGTLLHQGFQSPVGECFFDDITYTNLGATASNDNVTFNDYLLYPSYSKDKINVILKTAVNKVDISITSIVGKVVQQYNKINPTDKSIVLNVSNLNSGIYIVKIVADGKIATRKIVKE